MNAAQQTGRSLVLTYLGLRKAIGLIGVALPFVLALGKMLLESPGIQGSISAYYYTVMRDVFVGAMCAIAVFMMSYRYEPEDDLVGDITCVFALGVALFPTAPELDASEHQRWIGGLHLFFAAGFFLCLAYFCLALFRRTAADRRPTDRKLKRNALYTACGYTILACLVGVAILAVLPSTVPIKQIRPVFWLEAAAILAFGLAWLTKGEAILKDVDLKMSSGGAIPQQPSSAASTDV